MTPSESPGAGARTWEVQSPVDWVDNAFGELERRRTGRRALARAVARGMARMRRRPRRISRP